MRTFLALALILVFAHGSVAFARPPATSRDDTGPEIAYRVDEAGDVREFRVITQHGELRGRIDHGETLDRISLAHPATGSTMRIRYVPGCDAGTHDVHLSLPQRNEDAVFLSDDASGEVTPMATEAIDCESLATTPLERARIAAVGRLTREIRAGGSAARQYTQIVGALITPGELVGSIDGCREFAESLASGCYYDSPDFSTCISCCEGWADVTEFLCGGSMLLLCKGPWCRYTTVGCGGLAEVASRLCTLHNCEGKPGDPGCRPPRPPCPGVCMEFCGPGRGSLCGECPEGRACCTD